MEMKRLNSGRLRAAGFDRATRTLRVEFDDGTAIDYAGVGEELWRRLASSGSAWSFYRDNIEEEFSGQRTRIAGTADGAKANPLDELFRK